MISQRFRAAVKLHKDLKVWQIAHKAGIHPTILSRILSGAIEVEAEDPRLKKVCNVIGFPVQDATEEAGK